MPELPVIHKVVSGTQGVKCPFESTSLGKNTYCCSGQNYGVADQRVNVVQDVTKPSVLALNTGHVISSL